MINRHLVRKNKTKEDNHMIKPVVFGSFTNVRQS